MKKLLLCLTAATFALAFTARMRAGDSHAFLWDPATGLQDLGSLGSDSVATAINDSGTVVGWYVPTDGRIYQHGFIWTQATGMVDIGVPGAGDGTTASCFCTAINSAGNVVGYARDALGVQTAFYWTPAGGFTTLGDFGTNSDNSNTAYAINDRNQVTGNLRFAHNAPYHVYLWSPGMAAPTDLGTIPGTSGVSLGNGINNRSQIVGEASDPQEFEPIAWRKQKGITVLGPIAGTTLGQATAINDAGQIVGVAGTDTDNSAVAFYSVNGRGITFLKGLGGNSVVPHAISQSGVIVGYASDATSASYGVMWTTPTSNPTIIAGTYNAYGINNSGQIVGGAFFP